MNPSGILDQVLQEFLQALQGDYSKLQSLAQGLFYYLAGIQIAVSALWLMFKGDPLEAFVKTLQIFFTLSVFYTLIEFGGSWMPQIINGFISMGASSSGISSLTPSSVMNQGLSIGFAILDNFANWCWVTHPFGAILACVILVAIIVLYGLLAAETAVLLIKSYVLVALSGLMFAFGANELVRPMAMNYFKAVMGIGLQLLTFYLIMGVGVQIGSQWSSLVQQAASAHDLKPFLVVLAAVLVFYTIVKNVPPFIAGLSGIGGFQSYGSTTALTAMAAAGMGARAVSSTAKTVGGAVQGGAQTVAGFNKATSMGRASSMGNALKQSAASFGNAVKDTVMRNNPKTTLGQKFNAQMSHRLAQQAASSSGKQKSPGSGFKPNQVNK